MKTTKYWFNTLPKELRDSAIKNSLKRRLKIKHKSLLKAVFYEVNWHRTKEGGLFWVGFHFGLRWAEGSN